MIIIIKLLGLLFSMLVISFVISGLFRYGVNLFVITPVYTLLIIILLGAIHEIFEEVDED